MFRVLTKQDSEFSTMKSFVKTKIRSLCKGGVNRQYIIDDALPESDALVMAYEKTKTRRSERTNVLGFAILRKKPNYLYLDVICASKVGSKLVEEVELLAKRWNLDKIQIASVPSAMPYWLKMGFVNNRTTCSADPELQKQALDVMKTKIKPGERNPVVHTFLRKLVSKKLGIKQNCKSVDDCSVDGFVMVKCVHGQTSSSKRSKSQPSSKKTTTRHRPITRSQTRTKSKSTPRRSKRLATR